MRIVSEVIHDRWLSGEDVTGRRAVSGQRALPLSRLEQACGLALGREPHGPALPRGERREPRTALADAVTPLLERGPCFVSFSGGRDSSAILGAAVDTARRRGLPLPVPITLRFPDVPSTDERDWQEMVIEHLGLDRWEVIEIGDELDLLGDIAQRTLREHGVLWPPNAHFHAPMFRVAAGATVLTGVDGDGLFSNWRWTRAQQVLHRRAVPGPRDVLRVGLALAPGRLRRPFLRTAYAQAAPWLRPNGQRQLDARVRSDVAAEPRRWDQRVAVYSRSRYLTLTRHSLALVAADHEASVFHPFLDPGFLAAVARGGGAAGYGDRTSIMRALFRDVLPQALHARPGKGEFGRALWRSRARDFAEAWDGSGIDTALVDPERLAEAWRAENPRFGASTLLHIAWLAAQGQSSSAATASRNPA